MLSLLIIVFVIPLHSLPFAAIPHLLSVMSSHSSHFAICVHSDHWLSCAVLYDFTMLTLHHSEAFFVIRSYSLLNMVVCNHSSLLVLRGHAALFPRIWYFRDHSWSCVTMHCHFAQFLVVLVILAQLSSSIAVVCNHSQLL